MIWLSVNRDLFTAEPPQFIKRNSTFEDSSLLGGLPLTSHTIKRSYDKLVFDRMAQPSAGDLMGIGHPLMEKALNQSARLDGAFCIVDGLKSSVLVIEVSSRVTDYVGHSRRIIAGITSHENSFVLLRDWKVLQLLNQCNLKPPLCQASCRVI